MSPKVPGETPPIAAEIRKRRNQVGMSQARLAELADISESGIRRIERGYELKRIGGKETYAPALPSLRMLIKIARALRWDPREAAALAGFDVRQLPDLPPPENIPVGEPHVITELWPRLTPKQRNLISDVAIEFAARNREIDALTITDNRTRIRKEDLEDLFQEERS